MNMEVHISFQVSVFNLDKLLNHMAVSIFSILKILFILERGREKERERNITVWLPLALPPLGTWPTTQACTLTGNQTSDPLVPRPALSPLSRTSQVANNSL